MPQWGRPPGAQLERSARRRVAQWTGNSNERVEEMDSGEEDEYMRRGDRILYAEQRRVGAPRRNGAYEAPTDDTRLADGMDYDLYDDSDSTVAYAVQLAMKDEEWLVDKALERIRRAQILGQKQVRLSKREMEALERKRVQNDGAKDVGQRSRASKASSIDGRRSRPLDSSTSGGLGSTGVLRNGYTASLANGSTYNKNTYGSGTRASGVSAGDQAAALPRSPSTHSLQPPQSSSLVQPSLPRDYRSESFLSAPSSRPLTSFPNTSFARPLSRDPSWIPPYQVPYATADVRVGSQSAMGSVPHRSTHRSVLGDRHPLNPQPATRTSVAGDSHSEGEEGSASDADGDRLHIVDVVRRRVPTGSQPRVAAMASGVLNTRAVPSRSRRF
ncbi:uncharacterized protein ACLA_088410 [Aspergillus clavatus NRRL 1]|uniref:Prenylated Rab acceptor 1 n=1 Tax=Aspergillus clavatus (strain ATCC 1007 / CBS 513.65 / DSM 816 / NCTC 3887 / NRRL 1 / QM 1276 / 107) TaxID=344612 RepID=A1CE53_ASPCL|nr:uncharacterized protein ACLA_088410 [Aspergillus clavatus NRRL 1]EAW11152.1 conserved hypothetical protein [Aspergillus clavatus NRRL 1]